MNQMVVVLNTPTRHGSRLKLVDQFLEDKRQPLDMANKTGDTPVLLPVAGICC